MSHDLAAKSASTTPGNTNHRALQLPGRPTGATSRAGDQPGTHCEPTAWARGGALSAQGGGRKKHCTPHNSRGRHSQGARWCAAQHRQHHRPAECQHQEPSKRGAMGPSLPLQAARPFRVRLRNHPWNLLQTQMPGTGPWKPMEGDTQKPGTCPLKDSTGDLQEQVENPLPAFKLPSMKLRECFLLSLTNDIWGGKKKSHFWMKTGCVLGFFFFFQCTLQIILAFL